MTGDDAGPRCEVRRLCAADGHREARLPDVTARIDRFAGDSRSPELEPASRARDTRRRQTPVHGVVRTHHVPDPSTLPGSRDANRSRLGTLNRRRSHVELDAGDDQRARPRVGAFSTCARDVHPADGRAKSQPPRGAGVHAGAPDHRVVQRPDGRGRSLPATPALSCDVERSLAGNLDRRGVELHHRTVRVVRRQDLDVGRRRATETRHAAERAGPRQVTASSGEAQSPGRDAGRVLPRPALRRQRLLVGSLAPLLANRRSETGADPTIGHQSR